MLLLLKSVLPLVACLSSLARLRIAMKYGYVMNIVYTIGQQHLHLTKGATMSYSASRLFRIGITLVLIAMLGLSAPLSIGGEEAAHFAAYIERFGNGEIDWDKGIVYGRGVAYIDEQGGNTMMARRAAQVIAAANIVRLAAGIRLDDRRFLADLDNGNVVIRLRAFLRVTDHSTRHVKNTDRPYFEVVRKTPLRGISGLTRQLLTKFGSSVSEGIQWPTKPVIPGPMEDDDASWLVLDARHLAKSDGVKPALFPKIVSADGEVLYDLNRTDPVALEQRGMARYVMSDSDSDRISPQSAAPGNIPGNLLALLAPASALAEEPEPKTPGRKRYIIKKVKNIEGLKKTNLVVTNSDAQALKSEDNASRILKRCRVIVIVSSPIGGVEGSRPFRLTRSGAETGVPTS
jgi:hypothetical protein